jgi:nitrite reductase (NO-forming)
LFRAFNKGALGMIKVEGELDKKVYSGKEVDSVYLGDKAEPTPAVATATEAQAKGELSLEAQTAAGKTLFQGTCSTCHQAEGQGIAQVFPPLAGSDYLMSDKRRAIGIVMNGLSGPVTVKGQTYNSVMPPMSQLNDDEIANILTFVRNSWGNKGDAVSSKEVAQVRASTKRPAGAAE